MLDRIKKHFKQFTCKHNNKTFIRNIYGDEITWSGGRRSVWGCDDCGRYIWSYKLHRS